MWTTGFFCGNLLAQISGDSKCLNFSVFLFSRTHFTYPRWVEILVEMNSRKFNALIDFMSNVIVVFLLCVSLRTYAQQAEVIKFGKLHSLLDEKGEQVHIINFWATWCAPCVKELPLFEALNAKNDPRVRVTLISLDFADELNKVNAFIKRRKIKSPVLLLDEIDYNSWIDRVEKSWGGAIPATLFLNQQTGQRKFVDRELKQGELEKIIASLLNE